ncbi:MAG: ABC transporter permease [Desulfovibrio sp.]|nr:ABC transporter permease [Desulfovibrio sp.]
MNAKKVTMRDEDGHLQIRVGGTWRYDEARSEAERSMRTAVEKAGVRSVSVCEEDLEEWDTSLLVFLVEIVRSARQRKLPLELHLNSGLTRLINLAFEVKRQEGSERSREEEGFFATFGGNVLALSPKIRDFFSFLNDVCEALLAFIRGRSCMRAKDFFAAMHECSLKALPIVSVTNLLFGLILAFVGAVQLTQFGVQIYVAGLVGIGMLRVMGAIMVGIVMAGRIGASYAALLGTMQVNEEIDALKTLGVNPVEFLVLPRMLALLIMVPVLTLYADLMGILGGYLVGTIMLDIGPVEYLNATERMVHFKHGLIGLSYATTFGIVIAVTGCYQGMRCGRSAQAVGEATTRAVVEAIVGIIIMTAIITIICNIMGI